MNLRIPLNHPDLGAFEAEASFIETKGAIYMSDPRIFSLGPLFGPKRADGRRPRLRELFTEEHGEWVREQLSVAFGVWVDETK